MSRFYSLTDDRDWTSHLQRGKAKHLPIQMGEVAEYPRRLSFADILSLAAVVVFVVGVLSWLM